MPHWCCVLSVTPWFQSEFSNRIVSSYWSNNSQFRSPAWINKELPKVYSSLLLIHLRASDVKDCRLADIRYYHRGETHSGSHQWGRYSLDFRDHIQGQQPCQLLVREYLLSQFDQGYLNLVIPWQFCEYQFKWPHKIHGRGSHDYESYTLVASQNLSFQTHLELVQFDRNPMKLKWPTF